MKKSDENFWDYFLNVQTDIIISYYSGNTIAMENYFYNLKQKLSKIEEGISFSICFGLDSINILIFSIKNQKNISHISYCVLKDAPILDNWKYQIGLEPYKNHHNPLEIYYSMLDQTIRSNEVYVFIHNIFKSSNKLHLYVYFDLNKKGLPKSDLKYLATDFLNIYLGDKYFFNHISRIKIVRRKLKKLNFIPLNELINLIEYKSVN